MPSAFWNKARKIQQQELDDSLGAYGLSAEYRDDGTIVIYDEDAGHEVLGVLVVGRH
jgi:hypothetical protein